ncbi:MAG: AmmeMemoRadiSam system radical SAM enzyme [Bacteroidales bacterium]|nr:AmmeMemoRadiSam system radical SAM enzyme [Bacteroidales bacterium]
MQQAVFYSKGTKDSVICELCPHQCIIKPGNYGICGARMNQSGQLIADSYGKITALHSDPIEKKPLYHFYPGSKILSVGSFGCNLKCTFCQNYHISQPDYHFSLPYKHYNPNEIVDMAMTVDNNIGVASTYNEPVISFEFVKDTAILAREKGLKNVMVSNGFINPEPLSELLEVIDAFNIDLKAFTNDFYKNITQSRLQPVLKTLQAIAATNAHLEITHLVIPGLNDDRKQFREMVKWIAGELGKYIPLHISRYFPQHKLKTDTTPTETIFEFFETAKKHLAYVYPGNIHTYGGISDTHCPGCSITVIERGGYSTGIKNLKADGKCSKCNFQIIKHLKSWN